MHNDTSLKHLNNAMVDLSTLIGKLKQTEQYPDEAFAQELSAIYTNLNTAWNARGFTAEEFDNYSDQEKLRCESFPTDEEFSLCQSTISLSGDWYLADIVLSSQVEYENESLIHINSVLISAQTDDEAYEKALCKGHESEMEYKNSQGEKVVVTFLGLKDLSFINDEIEDGTELVYTEKKCAMGSQLEDLITPKVELHVFKKSLGSVNSLTYMPGDIWTKAEALREELNLIGS